MSWTDGGTAHELPAERAKASFRVEDLTNVIYNGEKNVRKRRFIISPLRTRAPWLKKYDMTRPEMMAEHFKNFIDIHKKFALEGYIPSRHEIAWMVSNSTLSGSLMPHFSLFLTTIMGQGSPEQIGEWLPKALTFQIVGGYAQTELGHGSNVRGLRTVVSYDRANECFWLNTPTLQSMKWWNSNIGISATHATVYAQLEIDGKEYGLHVFIVQLRDENHALLPGVEAGDVGRKMGDNAIDTGYLRFRDVRLPRESLLAKRHHVEADGTYVKHSTAAGNKDSAKAQAASKLHYMTMMSARASMISGGAGKLAIAATIATRFSCVRRQGFVDRAQGTSFKSDEHQVLDYQVQATRVLGNVALAFAMNVVGTWMLDKFSGDDFEAVENMSLDDLAVLHASSSGLKALCTRLAADGIEDLRKCCGGHGYLLNSGIAALFCDYVWCVSAEGDEIVLLEQLSRYLLKMRAQAKRGQPVRGELVQYLSEEESNSGNSGNVSASGGGGGVASITVPFMLAKFRQRARQSVHYAGDQVDRMMAKEGKTGQQAMLASANATDAAARAHTEYFILVKFAEKLHECETDSAVPKEVTRVVELLCLLFAVQFAQRGKGWHGVLTAQDARWIANAEIALLEALRPEAVSIVDAFDIPDFVLNSTIGRSDGKVYEALYEAAKQTKLNHQEFEGYKFLRPHLDLDTLKEGREFAEATTRLARAKL